MNIIHKSSKQYFLKKRLDVEFFLYDHSNTFFSLSEEMQLNLFLIILCGILGDVHTWGIVGHRIIARLAQSQLTNTTTDWVRSLIPWHWKGNMSSMASWADDIIHSNTNPTGYDNWKWSNPLHYINTPDWACNYHSERDCINDRCIDGAIRNYTKRLETKLDLIQHQEALYFLIHFVGDIHQPLHAGFTSDRGGNSIRVRFLNNSLQTELHSLWDTGIIDARIKRDFHSNQNLYYDHIYDQMLYNLPLTAYDNDIQQWINEDLNFVCQQIYFDDNNHLMNSSMTFNLNETYYNRSYPIVEQRLIQAGYRLGVLLNRLAQNPTTEITTSVNTNIIVIVLFGVFVIGIILAIIFFIRYLIKHRRK